MNLLIEYFKSPDYQRHSEYLTCIHENLENEHIEKIYVFISDDSKLNFNSDKIEIIKGEKRPTYNDLFEFCNTNLKDQICIISNADIEFIKQRYGATVFSILRGKFIPISFPEIDFRLLTSGVEVEKYLK